MLHEQLKDYQKNKISNKKFGLQLSLIFFIFFLIGLHFEFSLKIKICLILLTLIFILISFFKSNLLNIINIFFLRLAKFISLIINPIIMLIVYIFVFLPFGIILKFFKYDPLKEKNFKNLKTFWDTSDKSYKNFFKNKY